VTRICGRLIVHLAMWADGISWSPSVTEKRQVVLYALASESTAPDRHTPTGSTTASQSAQATPPRTLLSLTS